MQIFISIHQKLSNNLSKGALRPLRNNSGLSLFEILIALALVVIVFTLVAPNFGSERSELEKVVNGMRRAIVYGETEATLRNTITRISIDMSKDPQTVKLQYNTKKDLVLVQEVQQDLDKLGLSEREKAQKNLESFHKNFATISGFDILKEISIPVQMIGLASAHINGMQTDGPANFYIYPSGEKDDALFIFTTNDEVVGLTVDPFSGEVSEEYQTINPNLDPNDERERISDEMFNKWSKR